MECEKCGGSTWVLYKDREGREFARPCTCRASVLTHSRLKNSEMAQKIEKKSFRTFNDRGIKELIVAKEKAFDYVNSFESIEREDSNSALFLGQVGCGKSHLSFAIANDLLQRKKVDVVYMPYRDSMSELKHLEYTDKQAYDAKMHKFTFARLLVIDDLFKGSADKREVNYMFEIINSRYLNHLPFVCSSEKSHTELVDIDEGIASRMIEQARGHSIYFKPDKNLNYRLFKKDGGTVNE